MSDGLVLPPAQTPVHQGLELETVMAAAKASLFEVFAIAVGQHLTDQPTARIDVEAHWRLGMLDVLRPGFDDDRRDQIDIAAYRAKPRRCVIDCDARARARRSRIASTS